MITAFQKSAFQNNAFQIDTGGVVASGVTTGGRGGVNPWPGRTSRQYDKWWKKEHARRQRLLEQQREAEKRVEALQVELRDVRDDLQASRDLEAIQRLLRKLERLQGLLTKQQAILDELEMEEVMMLYQVWSDD